MATQLKKKVKKVPFFLMAGPLPPPLLMARPLKNNFFLRLPSPMYQTFFSVRRLGKIFIQAYAYQKIPLPFWYNKKCTCGNMKF